MAKYRLSPAAERDLANIWRYTVSRWGMAQAEFYLETLDTAFVTLAASPQIAPACDSIREGYRRIRVGHHMAYFRVAENGIAIIRILHERADAHRHL